MKNIRKQLKKIPALKWGVMFLHVLKRKHGILVIIKEFSKFS